MTYSFTARPLRVNSAEGRTMSTTKYGIVFIEGGNQTPERLED
jgi:hypothetical protein